MHSANKLPFVLDRIQQLASDARNEDVIDAILELQSDDLSNLSCLVISLARIGHYQPLKLLIEKGADPSLRDSEGSTALTEALLSGCPGEKQLATIRELVQLGANPNGVGIGGNTPLNLAIATGRKDAAKLLLSLGADPHARSIDLDGGHDAFELSRSPKFKWAKDLLDDQKNNLSA